MEENQIKQKLVQLGLEEVEAQVYWYLLQNGAGTPLQISRETGLDRSKVYRCLEKLEAKTLIEEAHNTLGKSYQAASPSNLEMLLVEQEEQLSQRKAIYPDLVQQLTSSITKSRMGFEVINYKGVEGLKQMFWNQLSAEKEILVFGFETKNELVGKSFAEKVRREQVERKITLYELENVQDEGNYWYTNVAGWADYYRSKFISEDVLKIRHQISIYNDVVEIMNWSEGEQVGVEIYNAQYAEMQRQMFWHYWELVGGKR
jgi:sugar-specific transcriptional regulator TrmB